MKTQRICIYAKDIQRITGKSEKTGYRMLGAIRKKLGKMWLTLCPIQNR
jgi:hypothetical protein